MPAQVATPSKGRPQTANVDGFSDVRVTAVNPV